MKRSTVLLVSCVALPVVLAGPVRLGAGRRRTQGKVDYDHEEPVRQVYCGRRGGGPRKGRGDKPATDEQVLNPQSWHKAIFNNAEYVIYTGPGTAMFHHWVQKSDAAPPARGGAATAPAAK